VVNSAAPDLPSDVAGDLVARAMRATDAAVVISAVTRAQPAVVWANEAFTRASGYSLEEVVGRDLRLLHGPGTDAVQAHRIAQALAAGRSESATLLCYRRDGSTYWNHVSLSPVRDDGGRLTHWVEVQTDVTRRLAAQQGTGAGLPERRRGTGLGIVAQVSELLTDADETRTLGAIADLLVHDVVAWAGFFLDDGGLRPAETIELGDPVPGRRGRHGPPPAKTVHELALDLEQASAAVEAEADPVQQLLDGTRSGPVELRLDVDAPALSAAGWLSRHLRDRIPAELTSQWTILRVTVLPVEGRERVLGLLVVLPSPGIAGVPGLAESAHTVLHLTARRVGMAVENMRLHAREHRIAEALQRAMLPEQADVDGLDVWSHYAPSAAHAQVGGDWYDVLEVGPGVVVVVVGDVVGHDVEAAASMGQLRSVVRAYAFDAPSPGSVLQRVDQLVAGMRIPRAASLVLATLTRVGDRWDLEYARAGHLPPVLVRRSGAEQLTGALGEMIGFGGKARMVSRERLHPGDVLVFYTDGLIERRDRSLREGIEALVAACATVTATDAAGIGEDLLSRLGDAPEDDMAVVVVRLPDPQGDRPVTYDDEHRQRRWVLPNEPASIGRARHAVLRTCHAWDLPDAPAAELVVSELMANAVLHGWGQVALRLADTGQGLRIEVEDSNPAPPVPADGHAGRVGGYGMQIVERLADWGWHPSGAGKLVWAQVRPIGPKG
jgi:PAS domain S-box-containing protein